MTARAFAAAFVAALSIVVGPNVRAADLYGKNYYPPAETDDYEDRAFGACDARPCGDERPRFESYSRYDYEDAPYAYRGSVKDGLPPPRPHYEERHVRVERSCLPRWEVKRRLRDEGWVDLRPIDRDGPIVSLKARRAHSGRRFVLDLDRCSGEIVSARPAFLRTFGAYDRPHWRAPY